MEPGYSTATEESTVNDGVPAEAAVERQVVVENLFIKMFDDFALLARTQPANTGMLTAQRSQILTYVRGTALGEGNFQFDKNLVSKRAFSIDDIFEAYVDHGILEAQRRYADSQPLPDHIKATDTVGKVGRLRRLGRAIFTSPVAFTSAPIQVQVAPEETKVSV